VSQAVLRGTIASLGVDFSAAHCLEIPSFTK